MSKLVCKLDPYTGKLPKPKEGTVYKLTPNTPLQLQLEAWSPLVSSKTLLMLDSQPISGKVTSFGHWKVTVRVKTPGPHSFHLLYSHPVSYTLHSTSSSSFLVLPSLPPMCLQTLLAKSLGPFQRWPSVLRQQSRLGYNTFHLTPVQKLGTSGNCYCIANHNELSSDIFGDLEETQKKQSLLKVVNEFKSQGVGFVVDIVLNHISVDSELLSKCPDACYNLENSQYLRVAYELDLALAKLSKDFVLGEVKGFNSRRIETETSLKQVMKAVKEVIDSLQLEEFFQIQVESALEKLMNKEFEGELDFRLQEVIFAKGLQQFIKEFCVLKQGEGRHAMELDCELVWKAVKTIQLPQEIVFGEVSKCLNAFNKDQLQKFKKYYLEIIKNIEAEIRYQKLELRNLEVTEENPLVNPYFVELQNGQVALLNGFILSNKNVFKDIANKKSFNYLRRKVVVWNDCVKLRYGELMSESPDLWEYMEKYVVEMSQVFGGIKLDNAHSTPLNVSKYLVSKARKANPKVVVMAGLFTCNSTLDSYFVESLGIDLLIREALNAQTPEELLRNDSGLNSLPESDLFNDSVLGLTSKSQVYKFKPSSIPTILFDCTSDNPTPSQLRTPQDALPTAALVAFSESSTGSTKGFDELIPRQVSVFDNRLYKVEDSKQSYSEPTTPVLGADPNTGVQVLVEFYQESGALLSTVEIKGEWDKWRSEIQMVCVEPNYFRAVLVFPENKLGTQYQYKFILDGTVWVHDFKKRYIKNNGITNNVLVVEKRLPVRPGVYSDLCEVKKLLNELHKTFHNYTMTEVRSVGEVSAVIRHNPLSLESYLLVARPALSECFEPLAFHELELPGVLESVQFISVLDLEKDKFQEDKHYINGLKARCEISNNLYAYGYITKRGNWDVLNLEHIPQGFVLVLKTHIQNEAVPAQMNQTYKYLNNYQVCKEVFDKLSLEELNHILWRSKDEELDITRGQRGIYEVPGFKVLNYAGIGGLVTELKEINSDHPVVKNLSEGNWYLEYQYIRILNSNMPSNFLELFHSMLVGIQALPRLITFYHTAKFILLIFRNIKVSLLKASGLLSQDSFRQTLCFSITQFWGNVLSGHTHMGEASLAKALPNSCCGETRMEGIDAFLSSVPFLMGNERWGEARYVLLAFASVSHEGFVPNCLKNKPSQKDATWYFLYCLQRYLEASPEGLEFLKVKVEPKKTLASLVQSILAAHAKGTDTTRLDPESGVLVNNCKWTTWMEVPRDGAPIEVTALLYNFLAFIEKLQSSKTYSYKGVTLQNGEFMSFTEWKLLIEQTFEVLYWIPKSGFSEYIVPELVGVTGIYKDTLGSQFEEAEYQMRPNQVIAMALAPSLFNPSHAKLALKQVQNCLATEFGVKTLDSSDLQYDPSSNYNGKECVWLYGYFLKALANFELINKAEVLKKLQMHKDYIQNSSWESLPDFREENSASCLATSSLMVPLT